MTHRRTGSRRRSSIEAFDVLIVESPTSDAETHTPIGARKITKGSATRLQDLRPQRQKKPKSLESSHRAKRKNPSKNYSSARNETSFLRSATFMLRQRARKRAKVCGTCWGRKKKSSNGAEREVEKTSQTTFIRDLELEIFCFTSSFAGAPEWCECCG